MSEPIRILLVEDNPADARLVSEYLKGPGEERFEITSVGRLADVGDVMNRMTFNVVLLDLSLPDGNGLETVRGMMAIEPSVPIVVLTGHEDESLGLKAIQCGAQDFIPKREIEAQPLTRSILYAIQRKSTERLIQKLAHFDLLTQLPNRQLFFDRFYQLITRSNREKSSFAIFFIDLDRFKEVNDRLGHEAGDYVLKEVAKRISETIRSEDTVARFGGDEFTLLVPDVSDAASAAQVAEKVMHIFEAPIHFGNEQIHISPSIGIGIYPRDGSNAKVLLQRADIAMYAAKRGGSGQYRLYSSFLVHQETRTDVEAQFQQAVDKDEFEVVYQPRLQLSSGTVSGAEALLRWRSPERGLLFPGDFLDLAEKHGQMEKLGRWVVTHVLKTMRLCLDSGDSFVVSVNLSPAEVLRPGFAEEFMSLCEEYRVPPNLLELELTESQVVPNWEKIVEILGGLRRFGVRIAIDDFGSGYASLDYLIRQSFDTLKLDKRMIQNVPERLSDTQVVRSMIALCRRIGVSVVAEGVEHNSQLTYLKRIGCHEVQGFFIGKPMPIETFRTFFRNGNATRRIDQATKQRHKSI